jgi:drug/metabolite transporter (DMT)-like permease
MDLLSSSLAYISLNLIAGSVWQISRGGVIVTTAIFSKIFLKKDFTNRSIFGCSLAFFGITLVQLF